MDRIFLFFSKIRNLIITVLAIGLPLFIYLGYIRQDPIFEAEYDVEIGRQSVLSIEEDSIENPVLPITKYPEAYAYIREMVKEITSSEEVKYASIFKTTGKNDEEGVENALSNFNPDKVVSFGGDGTTLFTALCLLGTDYAIGIIPLGSANGMATELFVHPKPIEALKDIIMSETVAGLDLLKINDAHFTLHIGDVGINAQIVEAYEKDPNQGMATYVKYFLKELTRLKPFPITAHCDGESKSYNTLMSGIYNARKYGTGVPLNLNGNPMDGEFELVLVNKLNANTLIKSGLSKFNEEFFDHESNEVIVTDYAEIEFEEPRLLQLDDEVIGKFEKLKIEILKGAINFIIHNDNIYI